MNGRPPVPPGGGAGKTTVLAPKTRLAVGVVFIGALIYSMVKNISLTKSIAEVADRSPSKGHRRCGTAA
jgi:coproporphyrinogen III oxidase